MLDSLLSLSKFGVFSSFKPDEGSISFLKYNLFYGWNGSGKSTLSRVFSSINGKPNADFPDGNFRIVVGGNEFSKESISAAELNVSVFNQDFIRANLDFEDYKAKSILYLSEERIEEKKRLKSLKEDFSLLSKKHQNAQSRYEELCVNLEKDLSRMAKNIKTSFGLIKTSDSKLLNYNRAKLDLFISGSSSEIGIQSILTDDILEKTLLSTQSTQKNKLTKISYDCDDKLLIEYQKKYADLILKNILSTQIEVLTENKTVNRWVEEGLRIHNEEGSDCCHFCTNKISLERIAELEAHFNSEYQDLITELRSVDLYTDQLKIGLTPIISDGADFYPELQKEVKSIKDKIEFSKNKIIEALDYIVEKAKEKAENPFKIIEYQIYDLQPAYINFKKFTDEYDELVEKHNGKTDTFTATIQQAAADLELHFVSEQLQDGSYIESQLIKKELKDEIEDIERSLKTIGPEISSLEAQLVNAAIAADLFNKELGRFLGRNDIMIVYNEKDGGYHFRRNGKDEVAANLSEGEKTAIAFIYFITKLKESGASVADTIVVLDDPVSSFDSNHLHHAFGFIRDHLEESRQLFILTHNFEFFKLIRDWLKKKNKKRKDSSPPKSSFFLVRSEIQESRTSKICVLPNLLLNYESEYHYIFGKVLSFKEQRNLSFEESHFVGNSCRKILEAFLAFKYPSHKGDFAGLLSKACGQEKQLNNKVYSFINRYSHSKDLEVLAGTSDNLFAEVENIVKDVLDLIQKEDGNHFNEMKEICEYD